MSERRPLRPAPGIARDGSDREIAIALGVERSTLRTHLRRVLARLRLPGRQALRTWLRAGGPEDPTVAAGPQGAPPWPPGTQDPNGCWVLRFGGPQRPPAGSNENRTLIRRTAAGELTVVEVPTPETTLILSRKTGDCLYDRETQGLRRLDGRLVAGIFSPDGTYLAISDDASTQVIHTESG